jgi:F-type H+-transporting ATPase subunit delta
MPFRLVQLSSKFSMANTRVAQRYAKAIMEIAQQENSFDAGVEDIQTLRSAMESSPDLRRFLTSPVIDVRKKASILSEIFAAKVGPIMGRFLALLAAKGRATDLPAIVAAFQRLLDTERNVVPATITTALELDPAQKARVEAEIARLSGHSVRASYIIDPSIIGGFRARFEDQMIDATVRHQLERLRESFVAGPMN